MHDQLSASPQIWKIEREWKISIFNTNILNYDTEFHNEILNEGIKV